MKITQNPSMMYDHITTKHKLSPSSVLCSRAMVLVAALLAVVHTPRTTMVTGFSSPSFVNRPITRQTHNHIRLVYSTSSRSSSPTERSATAAATTERREPETTLDSTKSDIPSWEDLSNTLSSIENDQKDEEDYEEPQLTLYRDTNGWCPFCERVWVAIRAKNIPHRERLINLQNKPDWYKEMVPTTLVPAVLLHPTTATTADGAVAAAAAEDEEGEEPVTERRIVWESLAIIQALDDTFPSTPRLVRNEDPIYVTAVAQAEEIGAAGFRFLYAGRNATLSEEEVGERRDIFLTKLNELDSSLGQIYESYDTSAPSLLFRTGRNFTAVDAILIPTLERWRYQLPLSHSIDILHDRPNLRRWFQTMDSYQPYTDRVRGDEYSWTAVTSSFQRMFGNETADPKVREIIKRADGAAERLMDGFAPTTASFLVGKKGARIEAARKLVTNYQAVVRDCTRSDPVSQKELKRRVEDESSADRVLRYVASVLLSIEDDKDDDGCDVGVGVGGITRVATVEEAQGMVRVARTVARRVCVPRDMGAEAACVFRGVLTLVADRIEDNMGIEKE